MKVSGRTRLQSSRARGRRFYRVIERVLQALLILFFIFVLTSMVTSREEFHITQISIAGAEATNEDRITEVAHALLSEKLLWKISRNNAIFYPKTALRSAIYHIDSHIEHVTLTVGPRTQLNVLIAEYQPSLLWCEAVVKGDGATSTDACYLADKNGYVYTESPVYSGYPFTIFRTDIAGSEESGTPIGLFVLPQDEFARIADFRRLLRSQGVVVREVSHGEEQDYSFVTDEGYAIEWSTRRDVVESAANLAAALTEMNRLQKTKIARSTPNVIDLRFENKIFYR